VDSKVWLITGCSSGLGRAIAEAVASSGSRLMATARNPGTLADLEQQYPDTVRTRALDVTKTAEIPDVVEDTVAEFGRLDVLVNNAGYGLLGALEELDPAQIERNLATNFLGPLHLIRAALPIFRAQQGGHIINISAIAAFSPEMGFSVYGAAKAALDALAESVASETRVFGVRVTQVVPGPFRTDFIGRSLERGVRAIGGYERTSGKFAAHLEKINGKQPGDPAKAAKAILEIANAERPPRQLLLGKFAHDQYRRRLDTVTKEIAAWEPVGMPADY
jgi:NAD(P)-dependent dehydrogenase (short-subunit alcohol dehydrogenase family)